MFANCCICLELTLLGLGVTVCAMLCVRILTLSTLCATENCFVNVLMFLLILLRPLGLCQPCKSKHAKAPLGVNLLVHGGCTFDTFGGGSECECAPSTFTRALVTVWCGVCEARDFLREPL